MIPLGFNWPMEENATALALSNDGKSSSEAMWLGNVLQTISYYITMYHSDSKVHGANMGPIWGRQDPGGPHVGSMNIAIWAVTTQKTFCSNTYYYQTLGRQQHMNIHCIHEFDFKNTHQLFFMSIFKSKLMYFTKYFQIITKSTNQKKNTLGRLMQYYTVSRLWDTMVGNLSRGREHPYSALCLW